MGNEIKLVTWNVKTLNVTDSTQDLRKGTDDYGRHARCKEVEEISAIPQK